jgi:type VI secretion system protein ImpH
VGAEPGNSARALIEALSTLGPQFDFAQFVRLAWLVAVRAARAADASDHPVTDGAGTGSQHVLPQLADVLRFRAHPSLAFPASSIQDAQHLERLQGTEVDPDHRWRRAEVTVNFLGLTGPSGVLPHHYTEFVQRSMRKDNGARDFFDIFNDLFVRLFYLAREKHRPHFQWERDPLQSDVAVMLRSFVGLGTDGLKGRFRGGASRLPDDALMQFAGILGRRPVSCAALARVLAATLDMPVRVQSFVRRWLGLDAMSRTRLGGCALGGGHALGSRGLDYQGTYLIEIGPIRGQSLRELLPGARLHECVAHVARFAAGTATDAVLRIRLAPGETPRLGLGAGAAPRLGFDTWLNGNSRFWTSGRPDDLPEAETSFRITGAGA